MTQTTTPNVKGKPGNAGPLGVFQIPSLEVPPAFREAAEQSLAQAKDAYQQFKVRD